MQGMNLGRSVSMESGRQTTTNKLYQHATIIVWHLEWNKQQQINSPPPQASSTPPSSANMVFSWPRFPCSPIPKSMFHFLPLPTLTTVLHQEPSQILPPKSWLWPSHSNLCSQTLSHTESAFGLYVHWVFLSPPCICHASVGLKAHWSVFLLLSHYISKAPPLPRHLSRFQISMYAWSCYMLVLITILS